MAAKKSTKKKVIATRASRSTRTENRGGILDYFRVTESYASLLLGLVIVIIAAVLFIAFIKNKNLADVTKTRQDISATSTTNKSLTQTPNANSKPGGTYIVQSGDDLWKIAEKIYNDGYKWTEIAKANNISNPGMIKTGQQLSLPKDTVAAAPTVPPTQPKVNQPTQMAMQPTDHSDHQQLPSTEKISDMSYTVVKGDYLWEIAVRAYGNGYKWVDIAKANKLANPSIIHSGNVLKLPR